ncbi:preprotein translocase subunit YajC [Cellulomonas sp. zg-ZUI222]|uniref:Preprotein translocase subunit YajC n=1 Tax=Cellulomonas wangleii TaxID=2816956 RepID=A0ABX8D972_9CELL|nr:MULTISPECIES: preprotein translocase subunit YajC [Cellulomonas]MBO0900401.1 preprotein translocase subunit YajC [Cellulomonas sp. zg-ZUI22]MBO0922769.1 preprotein translocase subunit YajC [Cellulomonas wangleii]MBO0926366.1 preprotein translocase subunit YajC [Cellulomonas wangleii]QVI63951.1 preprotein translocase subunit YajC [Cellulomonas wangleii]
MDYSFLIIMLLAFAALWFMSSRTRKQQREAAELRNNLEVGDEVMTASGLFGTVTAIDGDVVTLESTPGTQTRWLRAAIGRRTEAVVGEQPSETEDPAVQDEPVVDVPDDLSSLPPEPPTTPDDRRDDK